MTKKNQLKNQKGQVMVEYILILVILISIATVIVSGLVGRGDNPGFVITTWNSLLETIAQDLPDGTPDS